MDLSVSPAAQEEVPVGGRKRETIFFFALLLKIQNKNQSRRITLDSITAVQRSACVS